MSVAILQRIETVKLTGKAQTTFHHMTDGGPPNYDVCGSFLHIYAVLFDITLNM